MPPLAPSADRTHRPDAKLDEDTEVLVNRARRHRRRGEDRRALVVLREACMRDEAAAALWTLYGAWLAKVGKNDEARKALRHALWLRTNAHQSEKARVTRQLLEAVAF